jgi:hypothetical protein
MHNEVEVIEQYPTLLAISLAVHGLRIMPAERLLDPVDDRADLALVGGGDDQEDVCNGQLLGNVVGDQIGAKLVDGRGRVWWRSRSLNLSAVFGHPSGQRATKGSPFELMDRPSLVGRREPLS